MRWLMPDGSLEPVRCGASNRCDWCAMFAALEAALVLKLDAQLEQPTVGLTTTTRREGHLLADLRLAEQKLWRNLRTGRRVGAHGRRKRGEERFPAYKELRYCGFLEWTTGDGSRADGVRRPHIHHLTKGIPADDPRLEPISLTDVPRSHPFVRERKWIEPSETTTLLELHVSELWHAITGDAFQVECRPLRTPAGAIAYLALHHHKKRQAPPAGFTGRRLRPSKGYYAQPIAELRQLARELAYDQRVAMAARKVIGIELFHADAPAEWETDAQLTRALVEGLRSLARDPIPIQYGLEVPHGYTKEAHERERQELVERTKAALARIHAEEPPLLVRVQEREEVDEQTGALTRTATAVLGPVEARPPKRERKLAAAA
jgi:hypothetical protein